MNQTNGSPPKVSVGMPIYNGAPSLRAALQNIIDQTEHDLEIIISDNASTDTTPEICREFAARDPRIRYFRQPATVNPTENFKFVFGQARAPYFMWAAHDDVRDLEFIAKLLAALEARPDAVLAFGDVVEHDNGTQRTIDLQFVNAGLSQTRRLRWAALSQLHHLYGLWRTEALRRVTWQHTDWWHDMPLMMAASLVGDFIHVPGAHFHYEYNLHPFFDWKHRPGMRGALASAGQLAGRTKDVIELIWLSGKTVANVAGVRAGCVAAYYATLKIAGRVAHGIDRSARTYWARLT